MLTNVPVPEDSDEAAWKALAACLLTDFGRIDAPNVQGGGSTMDPHPPQDGESDDPPQQLVFVEVDHDDGWPISPSLPSGEGLGNYWFQSLYDIADTPQDVGRDDDDRPRYCQMCNIHLNVGQWAEHCTGKKHLKKTRQARARQAAEAQSTGAAGSSTAVPKPPPPALPTFLLTQPAERPPPGHINLRCYNALSGEVMGYITAPEDASWGYIAARVALRMPDYKAVPPSNARTVRARDLDGVSVLRL